MINTEAYPITVERLLADGTIERLWVKPGYLKTITVRELVKP